MATASNPTTEACPTPLPEEAETAEQRLERIGIYHTQGGGSKPTTLREKKRNEMSEWTPSLFSATKTSTSGATGKLFNVQETELFTTEFQDLIHSNKAIKRVEIVERIKNNSGLCHLLQNYTPVQLSDKVRTERKIFQRHQNN